MGKKDDYENKINNSNTAWTRNRGVTDGKDFTIDSRCN
jgi:hypothetical protein